MKIHYESKCQSYRNVHSKITPQNIVSGRRHTKYFNLKVLGQVMGHQWFSKVSVCQKPKGWDFPGGLVVGAPRFHCRGPGFDPWSRK